MNKLSSMSEYGKAQRALAPKRYNATRRKGRKIPRGHHYNFARELTKAIIARGITSMAVTQRVRAHGHDLTHDRILAFTSGAQIPDPTIVEIICEALETNANERSAMHRAAARDYGFEV